MGAKPPRTLPRFRVEPFSSAFQPGVDPSRLNQLAHELEVEDFVAKVPRRRGRR
jgi:hypothetical protein